MPKRSRLKIESKESRALKKLRLFLGLSQREMARRLNVNPTLVNHTENGRAYISPDYINHFLNSLNISKNDWNELLNGKDMNLSKRDECKKIIDELSIEKLDVVCNFLNSFIKS